MQSTKAAHTVRSIFWKWYGRHYRLWERFKSKKRRVQLPLNRSHVLMYFGVARNSREFVYTQ